MGQPLLLPSFGTSHKALLDEFSLVDKASDALLLRQHIKRRGIKYEDAAHYLKADYEKLLSLFLGNLNAIDHETIKQYLEAVKEAIDLGIPIE